MVLPRCGRGAETAWKPPARAASPAVPGAAAGQWAVPLAAGAAGARSASGGSAGGWWGVRWCKRMRVLVPGMLALKLNPWEAGKPQATLEMQPRPPPQGCATARLTHQPGRRPAPRCGGRAAQRSCTRGRKQRSASLPLKDQSGSQGRRPGGKARGRCSMGTAGSSSSSSGGGSSQPGHSRPREHGAPPHGGHGLRGGGWHRLVLLVLGDAVARGLTAIGGGAPPTGRAGGGGAPRPPPTTPPPPPTNTHTHMLE
jgi:hypothetical protein